MITSGKQGDKVERTGILGSSPSLAIISSGLTLEQPLTITRPLYTDKYMYYSKTPFWHPFQVGPYFAFKISTRKFMVYEKINAAVAKFAFSEAWSESFFNGVST